MQIYFSLPRSRFEAFLTCICAALEKCKLSIIYMDCLQAATPERAPIPRDQTKSNYIDALIGPHPGADGDMQHRCNGSDGAVGKQALNGADVCLPRCDPKTEEQEDITVPT